MSAAAVRCPECDEPLDGNLGRVPAAIDGDGVRVALICLACSEPIEVVGELKQQKANVVYE